MPRITIDTGDGAPVSPNTEPTSPTSPTFSMFGSAPTSPTSPGSPSKFMEKIDSLKTQVSSTMFGESPMSRGNTMKSQSSLRSGGTLLEKGLSMGFQDSLFSSRTMRENSLDTCRTLDSAGLKQHVKKRRGIADRAPTLYENFDKKAEVYFVESLEQPWCLETCMDKPECQRICNPAEYATRHRRDAESQDASGGKAGATGDAERMFGFPEWAKAGYCIMSQEESGWVDERLYKRLGLQLAIHRKTSVERLCLQRTKASLPTSVTKETLMALTKNLKRCHHVNILCCHDVCEDESHIYLLYENFPCITLLAVMEEHTWSQEQLVNVVRECCAAVAYATSVGLPHLGWTLCHILLPLSCLSGDPLVAKIFGFGLMGNVHLECTDRMCWAPEALESWQKNPDSFLTKMETSLRFACDNWSLGTIIYTLIARRPPILGTPEVITDMIIARKWTFSLAFDQVDREAKTIVEGLLEKNADFRLKAEHTLRNEWIRRRWRPPPHGHRTFLRLEEFCNSPLPKRLFGRFLVRYLNAEHLRMIAHSFYALDSQGDGVICGRDLSMAAKLSDRPQASARMIHDWMAPDGSTISLTRFAECLAEEVIDGRALRHAFESLDDDGSECISPEELYSELHAMDEDVTMEQIIEHIETAEQGVAGVEEEEKNEKNALAGGAEGAKAKAPVEPDHQIDFDEFVCLFPVRVARLKALQDRIKHTMEHAAGVSKTFGFSGPEAHKWVATLEHEKQCIDKVANNCGKGESKEETEEAVKALKKHVHRVSEYLRHPPGPADAKHMAQLFQGTMKRSRGKTKKTDKDFYGWDSFMQDQAVKEFWGNLVQDEMRLLRQAYIKDTKNGDHVDHMKANDAAETVTVKLADVISWATSQIEEYESFVEVLADVEKPMPFITFSSRGLQKHGEDDGDDDDEEDGERNDDDTNTSNIFTRVFNKVRGSVRQSTRTAN